MLKDETTKRGISARMFFESTSVPHSVSASSFVLRRSRAEELRIGGAEGLGEGVHVVRCRRHGGKGGVEWLGLRGLAHARRLRSGEHIGEAKRQRCESRGGT